MLQSSEDFFCCVREIRIDLVNQFTVLTMIVEINNIAVRKKPPGSFYKRPGGRLSVVFQSYIIFLNSSLTTSSKAGRESFTVSFTPHRLHISVSSAFVRLSLTLIVFG